MVKMHKIVVTVPNLTGLEDLSGLRLRLSV